MRLVYLTIGFVSLGLGINWDSFADFTDELPFYCYRWPALLKVPKASFTQIIGAR